MIIVCILAQTTAKAVLALFVKIFVGMQQSLPQINWLKEENCRSGACAFIFTIDRHPTETVSCKIIASALSPEERGDYFVLQSLSKHRGVI